MIEEQLDNWWRCYKDSVSYQRTTLSLEGRYRIQRQDIDYEEEAPPPARKPINIKDARHIENIVTSLPDTYKLILVIEYMYRWALADKRFHKTCRIAKVKPHQWELCVKIAKNMVENRLNKTVDTAKPINYAMVTT